jgi:hypothetical protein
MRASPARSTVVSGVKSSTKAIRPEGSRHGWQDAAKSAGRHSSLLVPESASLSVTRSQVSRHRIVARIVQPKVTFRQSSDSMISSITSMSRPSNSNWSAIHPPVAPCRAIGDHVDAPCASCRYLAIGQFAGRQWLHPLCPGKPNCRLCGRPTTARGVMWSAGWADDRNGMSESAIAAV